MKKVILADGTIIDNCTDSTTSNEIYAVRPTYEEAAAVRSLFTSNNTTTIEVQSEDSKTITVGFDLVLITGAKLSEDDNGIICEINTRMKTTVEKMQDQIEELQEAIIEG